MGCWPGSKFSCFFFFFPVPVPASACPSGPRSSFLAAVVVATTRCLFETTRAAGLPAQNRFPVKCRLGSRARAAV